MNKRFSYFVGIDLGNTDHFVYAIDSQGKSMFKGSIKHSTTDILSLVNDLSRLTGNFNEIAACMETPHGSIVHVLQNVGITVMSINPKQLDRFRDRFTVSGSKDDSKDAFVLANSLMTDFHLYRPVEPLSDNASMLWEYTRKDEALQSAFRAACNQLYADLQILYPSLLELCSGADKAWLWEILDFLNPTTKSRCPGQRGLSTFLRKHRIRKISAQQLHAAIGKNQMLLGKGKTVAMWHNISLQCQQVKLLSDQVKLQQKRIRVLVKQTASTNSKEGRILRLLLSLPGVAEKNAAVIFSEANHLLLLNDLSRLRIYSGVAPVTHQSGRRCYHTMRRACNKRLRTVIHLWVKVAVMHDEATEEYYNDLRSRGMPYAQSLRSIGERFLRILTQMIKNNEPYDPNRLNAHNNNDVRRKWRKVKKAA